MLKKESVIKWTVEAKDEEINKALTQDPILISLDFSKEFLVFSFASEHTIVGVLLHKN